MADRELDYIDAYYQDKDLSLLNKLTLVIPTYNRNYYLSRCLWYHAHFPFGQIIVADSSPEEKKVVNRDIIEKIQSLFHINITYLEFEPETEKYGGDIYRKWANAVAQSTTTYTQICTDKEFFIPTALQECIAYLEMNKEYVASMGIWYYIYPSKNQNDSYILRELELIGFKGESDSIVERYLDPFCYPQLGSKGLLHSLSRTDYLISLYKSYLAITHGDIRYGELYLSHSGYLYGKVKYHYQPYKLRDTIILQSDIITSKSRMCNSKESSFTRYPELSEYKYHPDTENFYKNFIVATEKLMIYLELNSEDIQEILASLPTTSIMYSAQSSLKSKLTDIYVRFETPKNMWKMLPRSLQHCISICVNKMFHVPLAETVIDDISIIDSVETKIINQVLQTFDRRVELHDKP